MRTFPLLVTLVGVAAQAVAASPASITYQDSKLKFRTRTPADWVARRPKEAAGVFPGVQFLKHSAKASEWVVSIELKPCGLAAAMDSHGLFEKTGDGWVKHGRFDAVQAIPVTSSGWTGFYAVADCGISDPETGFHAAAGNCLTAVISDGSRSAVIESDGIVDPGEVVSQVVMHFQFLK